MENLILFTKGFMLFYLIFMSVLLIHEAIHLLFIRKLGKKILSMKFNLFGASVTYLNDNKYLDIFIISVAPNIILPISGGILLSYDISIYWNAFAFICILNLVNLFPFTADGSIILYSIMKMLKKE
ncbi:metalloprotease family protein [Bacillus zhangzhouensis]